MAFKACKYFVHRVPKGLSSPQNIHTWHNESVFRPHFLSMLFGTKPGPSIAKPKKGLNPYICFSKEQMTLMKKNIPDGKVPEIAKLVSVKWREMSEQEKKPYIEESERSKEQYAQEWEAVSEEDKQIIREIEQKARKIKVKRQEKKKKKELALSFNKPKRPMGPFIKFLMEDKPSNMKLKDLIANKMEAYRKISEEEKKAKLNEYKVEYEQYKSILREWEVEMLKLGYPELLRAESLKELTSSDLVPAPKKKKPKAKTSGTKKGTSKTKSKDTSKEKTSKREEKKKVSTVDEDPSWMREE